MTDLFDDLDDPFDPPVADALEEVAVRVGRKRRNRRLAISGAVALVVASTFSVAALATPDNGGDELEAVESPTTADETTTPTTDERPTTTAQTTPTTEAEVVSPPTNPVPTTLPPAQRDWTFVRIDAPGGYLLNSGDEVLFEWTIHNDGDFAVQVDFGCPWFAPFGSKVTCPQPVPTELAAHTSATGTARFEARHYLDNGDWIPIAPWTYYLPSGLAEMFQPGLLLSEVSPAVLGFDIRDISATPDVTLETTKLSLAPGEEADVTVTFRNDTDHRVWDWNCRGAGAPIPVIEPPPNASPTTVANTSRPPLSGGPNQGDLVPAGCPGQGWREPGWVEVRTEPVSAAGLDPGQYTVFIDGAALDLTVVEPT
jgi:hypothetical protein